MCSVAKQHCGGTTGTGGLTGILTIVWTLDIAWAALQLVVSLKHYIAIPF